MQEKNESRFYQDQEETNGSAKSDIYNSSLNEIRRNNEKIQRRIKKYLKKKKIKKIFCKEKGKSNESIPTDQNKRDLNVINDHSCHF